MKLAAAQAIVSIVDPAELNEQFIIPSVFDPRVVESVRHHVIQAAIDTGVARVVPRGFHGLNKSGSSPGTSRG